MKKHRLLLIMILIVLVISIILIVLLSKRTYNNEEIYSQIIEVVDKVTVVYSRNQFYAVKGCINKYYTYCSMVSSPESYYEGYNSKNIQEIQKNNAKKIYNMLDKEYIKYKNITEDNVLSNIEKVEDSIITIDNIYSDDKGNGIIVYLAEGTLRDRETNNISKFRVLVKMDFDNETFSIIPQDYTNIKYNNIAVGDIIETEIQEEIAANDSNKYVFKNVSVATYVRDMFNDYKERAMYNISSLYDRLDDEYKNKKFATLEEFKIYIKNRYTDINIVQADSYKKEKYKEYDEYIIIDTNNNYYIFREIIPMKYTLVLDTYTFDLQEFIDKYNNANMQEKVIMNLNKINLALNTSDYSYVYSKLADSFKTKNFPTLDSFETYAKSKFSGKNEFDYKEFSNESEAYYTYTVEIKNKENDTTINKTFIMRLRRRHKF